MVENNQTAKFISLDTVGIRDPKKFEQLTSKEIQKLKQQEWKY